MVTRAPATAIVAAAGSGERLGAGVPKAIVEIAERPMLCWSLDALAAARRIGEVIVAAPRGHERQVAAIAPDVRVVAGGSSRSESVAAALAEVDTEIVVVHDAARPLAPAVVFDAVVAELEADRGADAVIAAAPVADTLKRALAGRVIETVPRSELWAVQTPQAFRAAVLRGALDVGPDDLAKATDDASLAEAAGGAVRLYEVADPNPKVTSAADLTVVGALLSAGG